MADAPRCCLCAAANTKLDTTSVRGRPRFVCNDETACREEQARLFQLDLQVVPGEELWRLRTDRDALAAVIEQVRALHQPHPPDMLIGVPGGPMRPPPPRCTSCRGQRWPCPTATLLPPVENTDG